jgi:hypothetical protein
MPRIIRRNKIYGKDGPIPVGRTKFDEDFVYRDGGEECIPGTNVSRLRLARLGPRALGAFDDEIDAVVEGLRAERDAPKKQSKPEPSKRRVPFLNDDARRRRAEVEPV